MCVFIFSFIFLSALFFVIDFLNLLNFHKPFEYLLREIENEWLESCFMPEDIFSQFLLRFYEIYFPAWF